MRVIDNIPIWAKAFAASIVLLLCLIALGTNAYVTLERSASGLTLLASSNLPKQRTIFELTPAIITTHVKTFRYVTWASNGVNRNLLEALHSEIAVDLESVKHRLQRLKTRTDLSPQEQQIAGFLAAAWEKYHNAAKRTVDVAAISPAVATMNLEVMDDDFNVVASELQSLSALVGNQTSTVTQEFATAAETNKNILALGGVFGVLVSVLATLFVGRSIVMPIRSITTAMQQVSSGQAAVDIGYRDRKDEIGQMVKAISAFRGTLEQQNLRLDTALRNMSQGLCMFDHEQRVVVCNDRYASMYGLEPDMIKSGTPLREIIQQRIANGVYYAGSSAEAYIRERIASVTSATDKVYELTDGRFIAVSRRPMSGGGWVTTHDDITERRRIEARIEHMAHHDGLTDLANRTLFRERLDLALTGTRRNDQPIAVLMLDLDRFKEVNDTLGHSSGDTLLKCVAARLRDCVRENDTVARLGGDEFAIVQSVLEPATEAAALAKRILDVISAPFDLGGNQVTVGTSIGIAIAPNDGTDPDQILHHADLALYRTKQEGRGIYRFFEPEMDQRMQERRTLERELRMALANAELELHYQPLVNLERDEICGFEALLRWNHPERGKIGPCEFIALAEETGLIVPIGEWVLRQACAEAANWPSHLKVAVNLSPIQFKCRNLVQLVVSALASSGMAPDRLELEITESAVLEDADTAFEVFTQLHDLGVRIALDDFGTGYSSLSNLRKFPFDKIKIDRSFVSDLSAANVDALAIVRSVARLGISLGMATTAEGVETREQLDQVRAEGCTEMQGYYICPPSPASEITRLFLANDRKGAASAA
jgi:diguanylate cyclase (GGDEF)-like protein